MATRPFHFNVIAAVFFILTLTSNPSPCIAAPEADEPKAGQTKALFCAFGGVSMVPVPTPSDFESEFAVAVVEINSAAETPHVSLTDFVLFNQKGEKIKYKRLVSIEVFERAHVPTEGSFAYYLNSGGTHPWNGTLPAGKIQLRIKVALPNNSKSDLYSSVAFGLTIGSYSVVGKTDGSWPT